MEIVVSLALATMCFAGQCHPVLVGKSTPVGQYQMYKAKILAPGYGGDVMVFKDVPGEAPFSVHRTWTLDPKQRRAERIQGPRAGRVNVTNGCINVEPEVYDKLVKEHPNAVLTITD